MTEDFVRRYHCGVGVLRFVGTLLYVGYLVQVGLMMALLPWSEAWSVMVVRMPPAIGALLDVPAVRGLVTAFGVLHLGLVALEIAHTRERAGRQPE